MESIEKSVIKMLEVNMNVKKEDKILVLTDDFDKKTTELAKEVYEIIKKNYSAYLHIYKATSANGEEPDKITAKLMKKYPIIIMLNYYSLTHTKAREEANKTGSKIASMPGFTREMFSNRGPMDQDYNKIKEVTDKLSKILSEAKKATITAQNGTNIELQLGKPGEPDPGFIGDGEYGNLPGGEAFCSPISGDGILVINPNWHENLKKKISFVIKKGRIINIEAFDEEGNKIKEDLLAKDHRKVVAELGIGTNPGARNPKITLEAEKILGTIHIAFGNSIHFGGNNESDRHIDFVLNEPTLTLDNKLIIDNGKFLL